MKNNDVMFRIVIFIVILFVNLSVGQAGSNTRLQITSEPAGAEVILMGNSMGKTPLEVVFMPGNFKVQLKKKNFKTIEKKISIKKGRLNQYGFDLKSTKVTQGLTPQKKVVGKKPVAPEQDKGVLKIVKESPANSRILLDGRLLTNNTKKLTAGKHFIRASGQGYISRKYQVDLKPGQEKTVTINLSANPQLAEYLEIRKSYYLQSGLLTGAGLIAAVLGFYVHSSAEEYDDKGDELHSLYIRKVIMDDLNSIKSESMDNYRSARNRRLIGYGLWTAATAAVAAGIVTWYFTPENPYEVDQGFQFDFKF